jgi:hypothetical protein
MGGTGNGYSSLAAHDGGGGAALDFDCFTLSFVATVQVLPEPVVTQLDEIFEVLWHEVDGIPFVGVFNSEGVLVGTIVNQLEQLIPCLRKGVAFIATVLTVNYDVPSVRVQAASVLRVAGDTTVVSTGRPTVGFWSQVRISPEKVDAVSYRVFVEVSADEQADVVSDRLCELRALVRCGVEFHAEVLDPTTVKIFRAEAD